MSTYLEQILEIPTAKVKRDFCFKSIIDYHKLRFSKLLETELPDLRFTYFTITEEGVVLDDIANLEFGDYELGFNFWKDFNHSLTLVDCKDSTKAIVDQKGETIGYILVEKMYACYSSFKRIYDSVLTTLFLDLEIKNSIAFIEYLFGVEKNDFENQINTMTMTYEQYFEDTEFKKFIDYQYGNQS